MQAGSGKDLLMEVVGAVADGQPVDWDRAASTPMSDEERSLLEQLRVLEDLHRVHRSGTPVFSSPADADLHTHAAETNTSTADTPIPRTWGPLEIRSVLGAGGFGVVYHAWDPNLATDVALKVLTSETASAGAAVLQEARLLARVRHPNIVSIYGAERSAGQVGLWMEFVRGRTLKQLVTQQGVFSAGEAALIGLDLTRALAAVHGAGLVHRDVKPHNVMRDDSGRIVLMDFGAGIELSEMSDGPDRKYVGTPLYMAPELFGHHRPSPQTDLYSLGVLLFHLVTGRYPIEGPSADQVELQHVRGERRRLRDLRADLPAEFVRIVERAIDPDPLKRYPSAGAMEADLSRVVVPNRADHRTTRWHTVTLAGVAVLAIVAAGISTLTLGVWRRAAPAATSTAALRSLAVLPLRNTSGDPTQDYFVDGMTELLTADLSGVSALRVIADSAVVRYRGTTKTPGDIGRELHVDGIVEGSVARSGDRVRVTLQVIQAGTGLSVWGASFEREANDAFRLQADITRTLVSQLRAVLTAGESRRLAQTYVAKPEAQDLYLRARALMRIINRDRLVEARDLLEQATRIDPQYALAWASLSRSYYFLQQVGLLTPAESRRLGLAAAEAALERDSSLAEAHATMAQVLFLLDWNWTDADQHFRQALEANPSLAWGREMYARFLAAAGRVSEAVAEARRAEEADPLSIDVKSTVAIVLFYQKQYEAAAAKAEEGVRLEPANPGPHGIRGRALAALGRYDDAVAEIQEALRLAGGPGPLGELGRIFAVMGRRADAESVMARLSPTATSASTFTLSEDRAYIQIALGQRDEGLTALERAMDQRSLRLLWLRVDPRVDPLRGTPRFERLISRLGVPPPSP